MDICNPCGQDCSNGKCDNWKCSLGCVDSQFRNRVFDPDNETFNGTDKVYPRRINSKETSGIKNNQVYEFYSKNVLSKNINFNLCHDTWQTSSIDLMPVTRGKWWIYHLIASQAMLINVSLVVSALVRILVRDIHATKDSFGETKEPVWQSDSKFSSAVRIFFLLSPLLSSLADSIFDGLYFVRLQTQPRMIHVPTGIHVVQGFLIYLGELRQLFKVLKVF